MHDSDDILRKRQVLRAAVGHLADGLPEDSREDFIRMSVDKINATFPAPSKARMRKILKLKIPE